MAGKVDLISAYRLVGQDIERRIAANAKLREKLLSELDVAEKEIRICELELENYDLRKKLDMHPSENGKQTEPLSRLSGK